MPPNPGKTLSCEQWRGLLAASSLPRITVNAAIRPIRLEDAAGHNACVDVVARERRYLGLIQAPPLDDSVKFISAIVKNGWPLYIAEAEGRIVGWCDIMPMQRPGFTHCGILGTGLLQEWRGQGLGRILVQEALTAAGRIGLERVQLEVYADNAPAIALYGKLGFVLEGKRRRARKLDGVYTDILMMARLTPPHD
jgi:RimJ/RimL family protein N-acetyltransferase